MIKKRCSSCGKLKNEDKFYNSDSKFANAPYKCRLCTSEYARKRYQINRKKILKNQKEYYQKTKKERSIKMKAYYKLNRKKIIKRVTARYRRMKKSA